MNVSFYLDRPNIVQSEETEVLSEVILTSPGGPNIGNSFLCLYLTLCRTFRDSDISLWRLNLMKRPLSLITGKQSRLNRETGETPPL